MKFNKKAAIFDMDGTLIDSMPEWRRVERRFIERFNLPVTQELTDHLTTMSIDEGTQYLSDVYGLGLTREQSRALWEEIVIDFYQNKIEIYPSTMPFLQLLTAEKIPFCMATSTPYRLAKVPLERFGLLPYFPYVVTDEEVPGGKRECEIYLRCARHLGVAPADCMVFEDAPYAATTAKRAGFCVCGMLTGPGQDQLKEICDLTIHGFEELM